MEARFGRTDAQITTPEGFSKDSLRAPFWFV